MFTNPIFIHSFTVLLRLRWFEKKIDNVNIKSKQQSRFRRTATLNMDPDNIEMGPSNNSEKRSSGLKSSYSSNTLLPVKSRMMSFDRIIDGPNRRLPRRMSFNFPKTPTQSAPPNRSDREADDVDPTQPPPLERRDIKFADPKRPADVSKPVAMKERDIRFAEQRPPPKRRKSSVKPADMVKSIGMMESLANHNRDSDMDDGPALVIKGPRDESDNESLSNHPAVSSSDSSGDKITSSPPTDEEESHTLHRATTNVPVPKKRRHSQLLNKRSHTIEHVQKLAQTVKRTLSFDQILSEAKHNNSDYPEKLQRVMSANYVSWQPTIGGNSVFVDLTEDQREELGGVEYRALKLLSKILAMYFFGFHILSAIMLMAWAVGTTQYDSVYAQAGNNGVWWGFFTSSSAFNDVGFTLTANSMISFATAPYPLIIMCFFIVIGNTGFPCMLHLIIWIASKLTSPFGRTHESLGFLLDHPRRCFTLLFPASATWWLFGVLVVFNLVDLIIFIILDLRGPAVNDLSYGYRVLAGLFQAFCTRTAGFAVIDLSKLHVAVQVSYMVMMYVSVLPLAMSIRRTNVYEEQSVGVYYDHTHHDEKSPSLIATHLRKQLSFDLWFIFLALFIISIAEGDRLRDGDLNFTPFTILFEIVSAYGTVGMSLGYPTATTSFSGQFTTVSKLVIIALLYRGRHRGLPYALDRAIMLPSEKLDERDYAQEHRIMLAREMTMNSVHSGTYQNTTGSSDLPSGHLFGGNDREGERHGTYENEEQRREAAASGFTLGSGTQNLHMRPVTSLQ